MLLSYCYELRDYKVHNQYILEEKLDQLIAVINQASEPSMIDYATLGLASLSFIIAIVVAVYTKHQRDIAKIAEKQAICVELFDILYYLKRYNGEKDTDAETQDKKLINLQAIAKTVFSAEASEFIAELRKNMHDIPARIDGTYPNELSDNIITILEKSGITRAEIYSELDQEHLKMKHYFNNTAFKKFEELFSL